MSPTIFISPPYNSYFANSRFTQCSSPPSKSCVRSISDFFFNLLQRIWSCVKGIFSCAEKKNDHPITEIKPSSEFPLKPAENTLKPTISGDLTIATRSTGYIGSDRQYQFGTVIKFENGEPLQVSPSDFYLDLNLKTEGSREVRNIELPSSLFKSIHGANVLSFFWGNDYCRFRVMPTSIGPTSKNNHLLPFDEGLKCVEKNVTYSIAEFMHQADIPDDYIDWDTRGLIILSPQTKRIELGKKGTVPLDAQTLDQIPSDLPAMTYCRYIKGTSVQTGYRYIFTACGRPTINILLDRKHLYVHIKEDIPNFKDFLGLRYSPVETEYLFHEFFEDEKIQLDEENVLATLDEDGCLILDIPLIIQKQISAKPAMPWYIKRKTEVISVAS